MKSKVLGKLYLIPVMMGEESNPKDVLPESVAKTIEMIDYYIVENEKTARRHIKKILPEKKQPELKIRLLNKHTDNKEFSEMLQPCLDGINVGLMSEAGCPAIADPGAAIVKIAHQKGIQVVPMVGPSSILMAMMGSGFNGQSFAFNGYLPIEKSDKKNALKNFERLSLEKNQSQIFIETPYRNNKLFEDLLQILQPHTLLCIAADITLETEFIQTKKVSDWKKTKVDLHNRPCIFILSKD